MIQDTIRNITRSKLKSFKKDDRSKVGIGGYTLDVRISENYQYTSDVPENPVEDGSVVNDHIINKPIQISLDGEVADIKKSVDFLPQGLETLIDKTGDILMNVSPIQRTVQQLEKIDKQAKPIIEAYNDVTDLMKQGKEIYDFYAGRTGRTEQDNFFDFMDLVYSNKLLISIEMPFGVLENMRITSLSISKDNETDQRLRYKITAKEVRMAKTILLDTDIIKKYFPNPTRSSSTKTSSKENKGVQDGTTQKASFLSTITGG